MIERWNSCAGAASPANDRSRGLQHSPPPHQKARTRGYFATLSVVVACALLLGCEPVPSGNVWATAVLPEELDRAAAPDEADVIIYLRDLAPIDGVRPGAWNAPVVDHHRVELNTLSSREVSFTFTDVPVGEYAVFVLVDRGRPHVKPRSTNFPPRPGDYSGRTRQNVIVREGVTSPVQVEARIQVLIPEGYEAPLYLD